MKSAIVKSSMLSAAVLFCLSTQAMAWPTAGDYVVLSDGAFGTAAGEFNIDAGMNGSIDYIGFCLEKNEYVNYGITYVVDNVADYANAGGVGGANGQDPISVQTQWVYWNYLTGQLGAKTDTLADAVQNVIWYLEDELTSLSSPFTGYYNTWITQRTDFSIDGVVKVLNLKGTDGSLAQSQLIGEAAPAAPVPEPNTMLLFGAGMAGLAGVARRRKSN